MGESGRKKYIRDRNLSLERDEDLKGKLEGIKNFVQNINKTPEMAFRNGIYQAIDPDAPYGFKYNGWYFAFQLKEAPGSEIMMKRVIYVKNLEQPIHELTKYEKDPIMRTVFDVFLDEAAGPVDIAPIAADCVKIEQAFFPLLWAERNPNIVVPGGKYSGR